MKKIYHVPARVIHGSAPDGTRGQRFGDPHDFIDSFRRVFSR